MAANNATAENRAQTADKNPIKHAPFAVVEAYKKIRTNLKFLLAKNDGGIITFSSADEAEGKSTTSINMAIAFSQLGGKILLLDADMRRPSVSKKLKIENNDGLSNIIAGLSDFNSAVYHYNSNLDILTSGPTPPNPLELLSTEAFDSLLETLKSEYDYILIDTPPINAVSDALVVAPKTDGLLLVVRAGYTRRDSLKQTIGAAEFANINILGAIMNGSDSNAKNYKYRKYKYSYKYYSKY